MITLSRIRRWCGPLEATVFHPQWLVLRQQSSLRSWVRLNAQGFVIDVGCGSGWLRGSLVNATGYVGIDYPSTMTLGYTGKPDAHGDAECLPIRDCACDTVALLDVVEHLPHPETALREAYRILRPGGSCLIHVPFMYPLHDEPHDYQRFSVHKVKMLFHEIGFEREDISESTSAIESAAALLSIALAQCVLYAFRGRKLSLVLAPLLVFMVPIVNLVGYLLGWLFPRSSIMPFSYRVKARKPKSAMLIGD